MGKEKQTLFALVDNLPCGEVPSAVKRFLCGMLQLSFIGHEVSQEERIRFSQRFSLEKQRIELDKVKPDDIAEERELEKRFNRIKKDLIRSNPSLLDGMDDLTMGILKGKNWIGLLGNAVLVNPEVDTATSTDHMFASFIGHEMIHRKCDLYGLPYGGRKEEIAADILGFVVAYNSGYDAAVFSSAFENIHKKRIEENKSERRKNREREVLSLLTNIQILNLGGDVEKIDYTRVSRSVYRDAVDYDNYSEHPYSMTRVWYLQKTASMLI